ncbi:MAG: di-trans,poly-cis-decaprenylcistransferase [Clostridia bacterium]|nr:di-trans,poly-cis-decaprenylcistransferase [Clostridia bacterium]
MNDLQLKTEAASLVQLTGLRHIAFIMDGNGRWATHRALPREAGHKAGAETFKNVVRLCGDIGIEAVTVYAFSTENWKRPAGEVNAIMRLLDSFIKDAEEANDENNIRYVFLGDKYGLNPALAEKCIALENLTANNRFLLNIALNYGGRAEITTAVRKLVLDGKTDVTEADVSEALYTAHCPDPDLIVRTAGEYRLSNFLLWQSAYAELYFTDTLWPDFTLEDLYQAVLDFSKRKRRYGSIG